MFKNRKIQLLGALILIVATVLVTLSAIRPPASEIDSATRSYIAWGNALRAANKESVKPPASMPGASAYSDYFQRHPELSQSNTMTDLSDYFLRHPE